MTRRPSDPDLGAEDRNDDPTPHPNPGTAVPPPKTTKPAPTSEPPPDQTRVLLTGDHRDVVTEEWIPTAEFGFRINVRGQHFEHVADAVDSGTWIFAPTR